jgi:hypothetical protein
MSHKHAIVAEPLDRIELLRVQLLTGLMRRDNRVWQSRRAAGGRAIDPREVVRPWNNGAPRYIGDGGFDDYHCTVLR